MPRPLSDDCTEKVLRAESSPFAGIRSTYARVPAGPNATIASVSSLWHVACIPSRYGEVARLSGDLPSTQEKSSGVGKEQ